MSEPSKQLADLICEALENADIVDSASLVALKQQILSGKTKSEDWYLAIEKNMLTVEAGGNDGN